MSAEAAVLILGVVLIVLALVYFLVSTILELRKVVAGLDDVIEHVGGIVEKSGPVNDVVTTINEQLDAAKGIVPSVEKIAAIAEAGSRDLDAAALLLTTQDQVARTVAGVAGYGGSLDVILDDHEERA